MQEGEPTKLPVVLGGVRMLAVAVPLASTPPPTAFTVIVSTCVVPIGLVAFCGVIWMNASTTVSGSQAPCEGVNALGVLPSPR